MKFKIVILIFLLFNSCKIRNKIHEDNKTRYLYSNTAHYFDYNDDYLDSISNCDFFLSKISEYWKNDSLGLNGFRETIFLTMINKCDTFKGKKWNYIQNFLGKPNEILNGNPTTSYTYYSLKQEGKSKIDGHIIIFYVENKDSSISGVIKRKDFCDG